MAQIEIDVSGVEQSEGFAPVPAGDYIAHIEASEIKPTKANTGHYLQLEFVIDDRVEGTPDTGMRVAGRKVWDRLNLWNPSSEAVSIAQKDLSAIGHSVGVTMINDSEQLHNKPIKITIGIDGTNNEIKAYAVAPGMAAPTPAGAPPINAAPPGSPPAQQQAPAQQAAPAAPGGSVPPFANQ